MHFFRRSWAFLFFALLLQLIFNPCLETEFGVAGKWILISLNSLVVITVVHKLAIGRVRFIVALLLGIPTLVLYWIPRSTALDLTMSILTGCLYLYAVLLLLPYLLRAHKIGIDELFGASSLYILIGLTWALLYLVLEITIPGSFHISDAHNPDGVLLLGDFTYYSFVTLTTLGYGDLVPVSCQARSLAILEAISGLLTLSVVFARIVSLYAAQLVGGDKKRDV